MARTSSVVEMLALNRGMIAQHDVAAMQPLAAIRARPSRTAIPTEWRRKPAAPGALRDQFAVGAHQPDRKVLYS